MHVRTATFRRRVWQRRSVKCRLRLALVAHAHLRRMIGAVAGDDVNLPAEQFEVELLEQLCRDHGHLVLGKVNARALVDAAAKANN